MDWKILLGIFYFEIIAKNYFDTIILDFFEKEGENGIYGCVIILPLGSRRTQGISKRKALKYKVVRFMPISYMIEPY